MIERGSIRLSDQIEGDFELVPMRFTWSSGQATDYPPTVRLMPVDAQALHEEYLACIDELADSYLWDRREALKCPLNEAVQILQEYGFFEKYKAYGITEVGSTSFLPQIGVITRRLFEQTINPCCRIHYAVGREGWRTPFHRDCEDFTRHGLRIIIPISVSAHFKFTVDGKQESFELTPGHVWLVNNAIEHSACNPDKRDRVAILAQLMDDSLLKDYLPTE